MPVVGSECALYKTSCLDKYHGAVSNVGLSGSEWVGFEKLRGTLVYVLVSEVGLLVGICVPWL